MGNSLRFDNDFRGCGCDEDRNCDRFRDNRRSTVKDLEFDIRTVRCGIADVRRAIRLICDGCVCDGIEKAQMGACNMEMGINNLITRVEGHDASCKSKRMIDEAICDLKEAICLINEGIEAIQSGCIKEGIRLLERAICTAEEGLCDLMEALRKVC